MKEIKEKKIESKVISEEDIFRIGNLFSNECSRDERMNSTYSIMIKINCFDGTSYESGSFKSIKESEIINIKKVESIKFEYLNYNLDKVMSLFIKNGDYHNSKFVVKGEDMDWVNGVFNRGKDIINSFEPQDNFILRNKKLIRNIGAVIIGIIILFIFYKAIAPINETTTFSKMLERNFWFTVSLVIYFAWILGGALSVKLFREFFKLWPDIEFDFGAKHFKKKKLKRALILMILSTIIIPVCWLIIEWWFLN
ncbi:hypothetical protein [Natroniella sp. ANB-PHB2]|uniref:hypothetical protein n=1 Tax=Natroniella sp. ANB-PHB2 TaxID=3384444 RepID=UPI0038D4BEFC